MPAMKFRSTSISSPTNAKYCRSSGPDTELYFLNDERLDGALVLNHGRLDLVPSRRRGPENDLDSDRPQLQSLIAVNDLGDDPELGSELIDEGLAGVRPVGPLGKEIRTVFEFVDNATRPLSAVCLPSYTRRLSCVRECIPMLPFKSPKARYTNTAVASERDFAPGSRIAFRNEQHEHTVQSENARRYSCLGWLGARTRTWEWRNQNPGVSL